jgi:hypothetical protein
MAILYSFSDSLNNTGAYVSAFAFFASEMAIRAFSIFSIGGTGAIRINRKTRDTISTIEIPSTIASLVFRILFIKNYFLNKTPERNFPGVLFII